MDIWSRIVAVSIGGVLGVNARYWFGVWINKWTSPQFPWATFLINVSGSFLIGVLAVLFDRWSPQSRLRLLSITGFLGGYTTFSSYALESATLWERGEKGLAASYLFGSVAGGLVGVFLGIALARAITIPSWERTVANGASVESKAPKSSNATSEEQAYSTRSSPPESAPFLIDRDAKE